MATKIKIYNPNRLTNANHVDFHHKVYQYFTATTATKLNVSTSTAAAYQQSQLVEQDIVKRQSGSVLSPQLEAKDQQRDQGDRRRDRDEQDEPQGEGDGPFQFIHAPLRRTRSMLAPQIIDYK